MRGASFMRRASLGHSSSALLRACSARGGLYEVGTAIGRLRGGFGATHLARGAARCVLACLLAAPVVTAALAAEDGRQVDWQTRAIFAHQDIGQNRQGLAAFDDPAHDLQRPQNAVRSADLCHRDAIRLNFVQLRLSLDG